MAIFFSINYLLFPFFSFFNLVLNGQTHSNSNVKSQVLKTTVLVAIIPSNFQRMELLNLSQTYISVKIGSFNL